VGTVWRAIPARLGSRRQAVGVVAEDLVLGALIELRADAPPLDDLGEHARQVARCWVLDVRHKQRVHARLVTVYDVVRLTQR
jgi:hypothetical protein